MKNINDFFPPKLAMNLQLCNIMEADNVKNIACLPRTDTILLHLYLQLRHSPMVAVSRPDGKQSGSE